MAVRQNQNPGRNCKNNNECKSSVCYEGTCQGNSVDVSCYSHADCETGTYCNVLSYWPFQSVCSTYRKAEESCDEDWQCPLHYFCWYNTKEERKEGKKRCMEIWQADVGT